MPRNIAIKAICFAVLCSTSLIIGMASAEPMASISTATEYGKTLPPIGFVRFCSETPEACQPLKNQSANLRIDAKSWETIKTINLSVNNTIAPVSDQDLYGEAEHWTYPIDAGDCEDYVLLKKRLLQEAGFAANDLRITVVLDDKKEGHAVLTLTTDQGDYILDNRRNEILRWNETGYKFLKRQSAAVPLQWVALIKQQTQTSGYVSSPAITNKSDK